MFPMNFSNAPTGIQSNGLFTGSLGMPTSLSSTLLNPNLSALNQLLDSALQQQKMTQMLMSTLLPQLLQASVANPGFTLTTLPPPPITLAPGSPPTTPQIGGATNPKGIMALSAFDLQLPTGADGKPETIKGNELAAYNSRFFQKTEDGLTFFAPVGGVRTANSNFPRSELAQRDAWMLGDDMPHSLNATLTVNQAPSSRDIVVGQLHEKTVNGEKPRPPIELHWRNGKVIASVLQADTLTAGRKDIVLADNVPLGQPFSYAMNVLPNGNVNISVGGQTQSIQLDPSFRDRNLYFKAGAYVQDNQGGNNEGGQVTFSGLNMK